MDGHRLELNLEGRPRTLHPSEQGLWNRSGAPDRFQSIQHVTRSLWPQGCCLPSSWPGPLSRSTAVPSPFEVNSC
jgi:hypothetical protein